MTRSLMRSAASARKTVPCARKTSSSRSTDPTAIPPRPSRRRRICGLRRSPCRWLLGRSGRVRRCPWFRSRGQPSGNQFLRSPEEKMEQRFPVNAAHAQLLKDPEVFDAVIVLLNEKDPDKDVGVPGAIPAVNAASAIALMNVFRFAMRPRVKGYFMSRRRDGQLVAVVQASDFVAMVEKG